MSINKWASISLGHLIKLLSLPEEKEILLSYVSNNVFFMATRKYSNFILNKIIIALNESNAFPLIKEIFIVFESLISNNNGNYLIRNLIFTIKSPSMQKLFINKFIECLPFIMNNDNGFSLLFLLIGKWDFEIYKPIFIKILANIEKFIHYSYTGSFLSKYLGLLVKKIPELVKQYLFNSNKLRALLKKKQGQEIIVQLLYLFKDEDRDNLLKNLPTNCNIAA